MPEEDIPAFVKVARGDLNVSRLPLPALRRQEMPASLLKRAAPPSNLPFQPTPFFGRETELDALGRLLFDPQCRLLTITGMGGIGKTRLVLELAGQHQDKFPGGVYFESLASISSPEYMVPAIAEVLGLTFSGSLEPREQLLNFLKYNATQPTLIVLDNLEHLVDHNGRGNHLDAVDLVKDMLQSASTLKLVCTSRERVNLQGEWVFDLSGMPYPAAGEPASFESFSATTLFVQRARQVRADFDVQPGEWPALVKICEMAEGSPLAIELAAAWVGMLTLDEIAREISSNLEFLSSSMRDLPERHRSMKVVFDYSWKMLSPDEQQALGRFSVFQGGFTRQAAEQVAGASLVVLSTLVSRSLVRRTSDGRFDMHELVRQYSASRLREVPQAEADARQQHFDFFLSLAETAAEGLKSGSQLEWLRHLEQDHDNLRLALDWSLANASNSMDSEPALKLAGALRWFWRMRGFFHEGLTFCYRALQGGSTKPTLARAGALLGQGILLNALGDIAAAQVPSEESAAIYSDLGDSCGLAEALLISGVTLVWQGQADAGCSRMAEALALYRKSGGPWDVANVLYRLGSSLSDFRGDITGRRMLEEASAILEGLDEKYLYISVLISLGILDIGIGEFDIAIQRLEKALGIGREIAHPWGVADALCNLGGIERIQGRYPAAQALLEEAQKVYQEHGSSTWETDVLCALAEIAIAQGNFSTAQSHLQAASGLLASSGHTWLQGLVAYFQGLLLYHEGNPEGATEQLEMTIALSRGGDYKPDLARALVTLGRVRLSQGEMDAAVGHILEGLALFRQLGHTLGIAAALEALSQASHAGGNPERSVMLFSAAQRLRDEIGAPVQPVDRPGYDAVLAALREALGEDVFTVAWSKGRSMSLDEI